MITLKNKLRRMRTFNLDAPFFVKRHGETLYGRPETLTLLALERREVEDAVLACTEIKAARDVGTLRVYPSVESASEPEPIKSAKESKPETTPEVPKPTADSMPGPAAEAPKPEPKSEPKTKADAKPSPRKTTLRRRASEED